MVGFCSAPFRLTAQACKGRAYPGLLQVLPNRYTNHVFTAERERKNEKKIYDYIMDENGKIKPIVGP